MTSRLTRGALPCRVSISFLIVRYMVHMKSRCAASCRAVRTRAVSCYFMSYQVMGPGGGVLPYKRLLGMCRWMGSHFHDWTDYNGVAFLVELLEWDRTFSGFLG